VPLDEEFDAGRHRLGHRLDDRYRTVEFRAGGRGSVAPLEGTELQRVVARVDDVRGGLGYLPLGVGEDGLAVLAVVVPVDDRPGREVPAVGVRPEFVPELPAEKLVRGDAEVLALDVPAGHVEAAGHRRCEDVVGRRAERAARAEEPLGLEGIRADESLAQPFDVRRGVARPRDLAESRHAGVRLDPDQQPRPGAVEEVDVDVGDFEVGHSRDIRPPDGKRFVRPADGDRAVVPGRPNSTGL
jgi:hypothetical protein